MKTAKAIIIASPPIFIVAVRDPHRNCHVEVTRRPCLTSARKAAKELGTRYTINDKGRLIDTENPKPETPSRWH